jgi:uncharacterized membrane protein
MNGVYLMAGMYVFTGIVHFIKPIVFKRIMPPWLPWHYPLIYISGAAEIVLGILLIPEVTRPYAAWGLIALLIAVFPANFYMASQMKKKKHPFTWMAILRLPIQIVLIYWALFLKIASNSIVNCWLGTGLLFRIFI